MKTDEAVEKLDAFLRSLVSPMLGYPTQLQINRSVMTQAVTLSLRGSRPDTGRLIGEGGCVFRGLRTLVTYRGGNLGLRVRLLPIQEPSASQQEDQIAEQAGWESGKLPEMVLLVARQVFRFPEAIKIIFSQHDEFATNIELHVSSHENPSAAGEIATALQDVFQSICKTAGRQVNIDVIVGPSALEEKNTNKKEQHVNQRK